MARPVCKGLVNTALISLRQRIRSQGEPWPRWRSARPGPHKTLRVVGPYFTQQVSSTPIDCQAISLPPPADSSAVRAESAHLAGRSGHIGITTAAAINTGVGVVRELNTDVREGAEDIARAIVELMEPRLEKLRWIDDPTEQRSGRRRTVLLCEKNMTADPASTYPP